MNKDYLYDILEKQLEDEFLEYKDLKDYMENSYQAKAEDYADAWFNWD